MFKEKLKADLDNLYPSKDTKALILESLSKKTKSKVFTFKTTSIIATCLAVVLAIGVVFDVYNPVDEEAIVDKLDTQQITTVKSSKKNKENDETKKTIATQKSIKPTNNSNIYELPNVYEKAYKATKKYKMYKKCVLSESAASGNSQTNYSQTNTRHKEVDEDDSVKTDGKYIYKLNTNKDVVDIYKANGKNTKLLSTIDVEDCFYTKDSSVCDYEDYYAEGIYLYKKFLVVIYDSVGLIYPEECKCNYCTEENYNNFTNVFIYNISNPEKPTLQKEFKQSGYCVTSRMINDKLYINSKYYIDTYPKIKRKETNRYIPLICDGKSQQLITPNDIYFADDYDSYPGYSVLTSFDIDDLKKCDSMAMLGNDIKYVSLKNIYYTEYDYSDDVTNITTFSINNGTIKKSSTGEIDGYILNEFSMDEYDGYLRLVASQKNGKSEYNSLVILDSSLKKVSSIEKLAKGERIYSARFMEDYAYFVTFKETDPLFCADISNPEKPKIVSELKIPGFSTYLHPFGNNKLIGFGFDTDEKGNQKGVKLSMFNIKDYSNVTEEAVHLLKYNYSPATYEHRAFFASFDKNLIGFASGSKYLLYSYNKNEGFKLEKEVKFKGESYYVRGLYIDNYFYITSNKSVTILDLDTFEVVKTV